jgi:predicted DCC family thiol-disulfide oxidoreductase YuxK
MSAVTSVVRHDPLSAVTSVPAASRIEFGGPAPLPVGARPDANRLIVLYDRDCSLCIATARMLRRWDRDRRLELLALQDAVTAARPELAAAARGLPLSAALHVIDPSTGRIAAGGDAALAIGMALPGRRVVRLIGAIPPFRWTVGLAYTVIARYRRPIGRWLGLEGPVCDLPR